MTARIYSFGYKLNGEDQFSTTGPAAPLIFDARCLNNPHNNPRLRQMTGKDIDVRMHVMKSERAREMVSRAVAYLQEHPDGSVAFGCAYGKHRSVALAEMVHHYVPDSIVMHTGAARNR